MFSVILRDSLKKLHFSQYILKEVKKGLPKESLPIFPVGYNECKSIRTHTHMSCAYMSAYIDHKLIHCFNNTNIKEETKGSNDIVKFIKKITFFVYFLFYC